MSANTKQVGGDHYKSEYQHWDWVENVQLPYLLAQVTRYVTRWKKKNGIEDLQKAIHYIDKAIETHEAINAVYQTFTDEFCNTNKSSDEEKLIFSQITKYATGNSDVLYFVKGKLKDMLESM